MRIYLIGAHSSGKSTLANYIANSYKLPLLPETARMVLSERELQLDILRSDLDAVDEYQAAVFHRQLQEEAKQDNFVSDRSLLDVLAYSIQHTRIAELLFKTDEFREYIDRLKKDDVLIFFVRPNKATLKDDGVREKIDWDGIISIDAIIKALLKLHDLWHYQISMDSAQERCLLIDAVLSSTKSIS
jgi:predicted ATPase